MSHPDPRQGSRGATRNQDGSRSQSRRRNRGSNTGSRLDSGQESGGAGERRRGAGAGGGEEEHDDGDTEDEEEQRDQGSSGRAASPRRNRPSGGRNFRGYQPGDAEPSPVLQGVVNCLTSISNQMLRMSGKSGKNRGWPYFDGTFTGYPAFKRKWQSYYRNHHQLTPQRELVQLFRENCLHEKTADRLKRAESMAAAWLVLDTCGGSVISMKYSCMLYNYGVSLPQYEHVDIFPVRLVSTFHQVLSVYLTLAVYLTYSSLSLRAE